MRERDYGPLNEAHKLAAEEKRQQDEAARQREQERQQEVRRTDAERMGRDQEALRQEQFLENQRTTQVQQDRQPEPPARKELPEPTPEVPVRRIREGYLQPSPGGTEYMVRQQRPVGRGQPEHEATRGELADARAGDVAQETSQERRDERARAADWGREETARDAAAEITDRKAEAQDRRAASKDLDSERARFLAQRARQSEGLSRGRGRDDDEGQER